MLGTVLILGGIAARAVIVAIWISRGFGKLPEEQLAILAATQVVSTSLLLGLIVIRCTG